MFIDHPEMAQRVLTHDPELNVLSKEALIEAIDFSLLRPEEAVLVADAVTELTNEQISRLSRSIGTCFW